MGTSTGNNKHHKREVCPPAPNPLPSRQPQAAPAGDLRTSDTEPPPPPTGGTHGDPNKWNDLTRRLTANGLPVDSCLQFALSDTLDYEDPATRDLYIRAAMHTARVAEIARAIAVDMSVPMGDWPEEQNRLSAKSAFGPIFLELVRSAREAHAAASTRNPLLEALMPEMLPVLLRVMTKLGAQAQAEAQRRAEQSEENDGGD